jgi:hypothetical protein
VQATAKPAAHRTGEKRSRGGGGRGRSSLLRSFQQWNRSHRQLSGREPSLLPRDMQRLSTTLFPFSVAQGIFWLSCERFLRSTLHLIEGGERSLYSRSLLAVPRWINYCCVMQFLPFLCRQGSLLLIETVHLCAVYTETLYNFSRKDNRRVH